MRTSVFFLRELDNNEKGRHSLIGFSDTSTTTDPSSLVKCLLCVHRSINMSNGSSSTIKFGQLNQEAGQLELKKPEKWSRVVPRTNATNNRFNERKVPGSLMNATNKQAR